MPHAGKRLAYQINFLLIWVLISLAVTIFLFSKGNSKLRNCSHPITESKYLAVPLSPSGKNVHLVILGVPNYLDAQAALRKSASKHDERVIGVPHTSQWNGIHKVLSVLLQRTQAGFYWKGFVRQSMIPGNRSFTRAAHALV